MNDRSKHKFHLAAKLGEGEKTVGWVETTFQVASNRLGEEERELARRGENETSQVST